MTASCSFTCPRHRTFTRCVQSLAKLGEELYVEFKANELVLICVSSPVPSALGSYKFARDFFTDFDAAHTRRCKVHMKGALLLFKTAANSVERDTQRCELRVENDRLTFCFDCNDGQRKTYRLRVLESESIDAAFSRRTLTTNVFEITSKSLSEAVTAFPPNVFELSLHIESHSRVHLCRFEESNPDRTMTPRVKHTFRAEELLNVDFHHATLITFCFKELKALLHYSDFSHSVVQVHSSDPGSPICFSVTDSDCAHVACEFVLQTLAPEGGGGSQPVMNAVVTAQTADENANDDDDDALLLALASQDQVQAVASQDLAQAVVDQALGDQDDGYSNQEPEQERGKPDEAPLAPARHMNGAVHTVILNDDPEQMPPTPPPANKKRTFRAAFLGISQKKSDAGGSLPSSQNSVNSNEQGEVLACDSD